MSSLAMARRCWLDVPVPGEVKTEVFDTDLRTAAARPCRSGHCWRSALTVASKCKMLVISRARDDITIRSAPPPKVRFMRFSDCYPDGDRDRRPRRGGARRTPATPSWHKAPLMAKRRDKIDLPRHATAAC